MGQFSTKFFQHPQLGISWLSYICLYRKDIKEKKERIRECFDFVDKNWGEFTRSYLISKFLDNDFLLMAYYENKIVGFVQAKIVKDTELKKRYYSIGFLVVAEEWYNVGLGRFLTERLVFEIIKDSVLNHANLAPEIMFITSDIRLIAAMKNVSSFIYPNPFTYDQVNRKMPLADEETWRQTKNYIAKIGERVFRLQREACVIFNSYDDVPNLRTVKELDQRGSRLQKLKAFEQRYISPQGRFPNEIVVRATCNIWLCLVKILRGYLVRFLRFVKQYINANQFLSLWLKRYLLAEIIALPSALMCGVVGYRFTSSTIFASLAAAFGENIGYYGFMFLQDFFFGGQKKEKKIVKRLIIEFGPAEAMDTIVVRPALIYSFSLLFGNISFGILLGKISSDILFVINAYWGRKVGERIDYE